MTTAEEIESDLDKLLEKGYDALNKDENVSFFEFSKSSRLISSPLFLEWEATYPKPTSCCWVFEI